MVDTWRNVGQVLKIKDKVRKIKFLGENISFSGLAVVEQEGEEERSPSLLLAILGVQSVGIHRAKN